MFDKDYRNQEKCMCNEQKETCYYEEKDNCSDKQECLEDVVYNCYEKHDCCDYEEHEDDCYEDDNDCCYEKIYCKDKCKKIAEKSSYFFSKVCKLQKQLKDIQNDIDKLVCEAEELKKLSIENYAKAKRHYEEAVKFYLKADRLLCEWGRYTEKAIKCYQCHNTACSSQCREYARRAEEIYCEIQELNCKAKKLEEEAKQYAEKAYCYDEKADENIRKIAKLTKNQEELGHASNELFIKAQKYAQYAIQCYKY